MLCKTLKGICIFVVVVVVVVDTHTIQNSVYAKCDENNHSTERQNENERASEWNTERVSVSVELLWGRCQYKQNRFVKFLNSKRKHVILQGECLSSCLEHTDTYLRKKRCCDDCSIVKKTHTQREKIWAQNTRITVEMIRNQMTRFYPKWTCSSHFWRARFFIHWQQYIFWRAVFLIEFQMNGLWHMKSYFEINQLYRIFLLKYL